jgi:hypothetical protein
MVWGRLPLTSILPPTRTIEDEGTKEWANKLITFLDDHIRRTALKVNEITTDIEAGAVLRTDYNANTMLYATSDDTPVALSIAASRVVGRKATGNISAMTAGETRTVLGIDTDDAVTFGAVTAGAITGTSFVIGANSLDTNEWTHLNGQDQPVRKASSPEFVGLTFNFATQDYKFTNRSNTTLVIQSQTSNLDPVLEIFTKDGDRVGGESLYFHLWGKGTPASITNREIFTFGTTPTSGLIYTSAAGTGSVLPISIYTGANTTQLVLATDNDISMSGALVVTGTVTGATGSVFGNLTLADGSITDSGGSISFGNENISTTGTADFGATTVDTLTLDTGGQDFLVTSRGTVTLAIQGQTSGQTTELELFTKDGDATDNVVLRIFAMGSPADISDSEQLALGFYTATSNFLLFSYATAGETLYPIAMGTGSNLDQLVLGIDGNNTMSGNLAVTGTLGAGATTLTGNLIIPDAGNIGSASDPDAIAIAADGKTTFTQDLTVNEDIIIGDAKYIGSATTPTAIQIEPDGDLVFAGNLFIPTAFYHAGDGDTGVSFTEDAVYIQAGGLTFLKASEAAIADQLIINSGGVDIDTQIQGLSIPNLVYVNAGDDRVGINTNAASVLFSVVGISRFGDDTTNYSSFSATGDQTFAGSAGFYPRFLTQSAEPAAGTGATQCDTSEMVIWKDSDDSKVYVCFNDGGTVKTAELT